MREETLRPRPAPPTPALNSSVLFDAKTQTWHDKLAGTYVVRVDQGVEGGAHTAWKRRER